MEGTMGSALDALCPPILPEGWENGGGIPAESPEEDSTGTEAGGGGEALWGAEEEQVAPWEEPAPEAPEPEAAEPEPEAEEAAEPAPEEQPPEPLPGRNLRGEVEQLRLLFPEVKEIPDQVAKAVSRGVPLLTAYLAHREQEREAAAQALREENQRLRQQADAARRAPVRGVSGTGPERAGSLFEQGFDAGLRW